MYTISSTIAEIVTGEYSNYKDRVIDLGNGGYITRQLFIKSAHYSHTNYRCFDSSSISPSCAIR